MQRFRALMHMLRMRLLEALHGIPSERHTALQDSLNTCTSRLETTRAALRNLERVIGSEIGKRVVERISHSMTDHVRRGIAKAVMQARERGAMNGIPAVLNLEISTEELRWLDPESLEQRALEEWKHQTAPKLRAFVDVDSPIAIEQHVTVLDIRVPELGYRERIWNDAL